MRMEAAVIREQGVEFAVVVVKRSVLSFKPDADNFIRLCRPIFGSKPVVLMAQDSRGIPTYYGRPDLVRFLANTHPGRLPWRRYDLN